MENTNNGTNNKKALYVIIAVIIVLAIVAVIAVNSGGDDAGSGQENSAAVTDNAVAEATARNDYMPVFMYFVSKNDEGYNEYMSMIDELKSEYDGRVTFDIVDVDEDPTAKENFPVDGNTPMLIMTNTTNDISAIEFKCSDRDKLKEDIENTLQ